MDTVTVLDSDSFGQLQLGQRDSVEKYTVWTFRQCGHLDSIDKVDSDSVERDSVDSDNVDKETVWTEIPWQ